MPSRTKLRVTTFVTNRLVNPIVRPLAQRGLLGPATALLETTGRKSGAPRRTPVGNGLRGNEFWIVTEHGWSSHYVKNIQADPNVRVRVGRRWYAGVAHILEDDDPYERMRKLKRMNDVAVRAIGTQHLVIRVDLAS